VVARQSIPRFDLYAELGVEPSADDGAIESAYHWQIDQHLPNVDASATRSRVARLNTARDWLSDSELRSRYDASRARAARAAARTTAAGRTTRKPAARRAKATAAETSAAGAVVGATALTAAEAAEAEARAAAEADAALASKPIRPEPARADFSWPAADLNRPATPAVPRRRPSRRMLRGVAGLAALVAVAALVVLAIALRPASTPIAAASPTAPPPTPTAVPETQNPTPEPTVAITAPPATPAGPDIATLQQAAWSTIHALAAAAAAGDVETAQTMLGDTAPDLRASGLKAAEFPDVQAAGISIDPSGSPYTAIAGDDRLTSPDGVTWTFDYGDRPLAAYRMPPKVDPYDLYWIESDGKHHLFLRVATATVSKSGVTVDFAWHYAADRPDDATYFRRASLLISSVTLDDTPIPVTATSVSMRGVTSLTATAAFNGVPAVPDLFTVGVTVSNPRTAGGAARAIDVSFKLEGR
jgi:hypothetical protein